VRIRNVVWRVRSARRYRGVARSGVVGTLTDFAAVCGPGARVLERPAPAPNAEPRPPMHLEPSLHPVLEALVEPWPLQGLCAGVFPGARLETAFGIVVARDGSVLGASAWDPEQLRKSGVLDRQPRFRRRVAGHCASLVSQFGGYFHWLTEALPRIAVLRLLGLADVPVITPPGLTPVQCESLERLGVEVAMPYHDGITPDVLVWARPPGHTGHPPRWACDWLREELLGDRPPAGRSRLYISRRDARSRRVANEGEVMALLREHGFDVVQPEQLTLREQAELFAGAGIVVAPHGAGNANLLFSRSATLVELFDPGYMNGCYYSLAQALGHPYWYLMCDPEAPGDVRVPLDRLERVVDAALRAATTLSAT
jgi:capsular polysaccharide biosynthesis protein